MSDPPGSLSRLRTGETRRQGSARIRRFHGDGDHHRDHDHTGRSAWSLPRPPLGRRAVGSFNRDSIRNCCRRDERYKASSSLPLNRQAVLENLPTDTLPRLLRRTTLSAIMVGAVGFLVAIFVAPPLGALGLVLGMGLAIMNFRQLARRRPGSSFEASRAPRPCVANSAARRSHDSAR